MIRFERWKYIFIMLVTAFALFYAAPNVFPVGGKTISLGLDLQGGSYLLLKVESDTVIAERAQSLAADIRQTLRAERLGYKRLRPVDDGVDITLRDVSDRDAVIEALRVTDGDLTFAGEGDIVRAHYSEDAIKNIHDETVTQSVEIVRRRVDETGTREPVIQRQGEDRILLQLPGLDDPAQVKALLGRTAKMSFHLVEGNASVGGRTLSFADDPTQRITVERRPVITGDMLAGASATQNQFGDPAVSFRFNAVGGRKFCDVTREHTGEPFAIVLDGEVISAPRINEPICGGNGIITGNFSVTEASDLSLLLRAGALPAPLTIMEERSVGPTLGADSVEAGKWAALFAMIAVLIFMILFYGLFGIIADIALTLNMILIIALLSMLQATLTLPGIAGIVLTVGMAVDANVLIFERIKEEFRGGRSLLSSIDIGFGRAMTTIIDSNLTTLIAALMLFSFGTGPIKGFAVTLAIGIIASMFCAVIVTRGLVALWVNKAKPGELPL